MPLLDLFPAEATTVRVAGRALAIRPLTLADLAGLDAAIGAACPFVAEPPPAGLDAWRERRHWAKEWKRARAWPLPFPAIAGTGPGRVLLLRRVADVSEAEAPAIVAGATEAEWRAIEDAAHGVHPADRLLRLMDPDRPLSDPEAESVTLEEAIAGVCRDFGWTLEEVGRLTLRQFRALRAGGSPSPRKLVPKPGETMAAACRERRRLLAETDEGPP